MKNRFSPHTLCNKFVTSATGRKYSERTRRVLTIIIFPIWIAGLVVTLWISIPGAIEVPRYIRARQLQANGHPIFGEHYCNLPACTMSPEYYKYVNNPWPDDPALDQRVLSAMEDKLEGLLAIPCYVFGLFLMPWLIIRLKRWVLVEQISKSDSVTNEH